MHHADTWKERLRLFLKIIWPIMITQLGMYALNLSDTIMSGRVSEDDLAGVAIGSSLWLPIMAGINGILMAVSPIVAQLMGGDRKEKITGAIHQSLYVSVAIAIIVAAAGAALLKPVIGWMELGEQVRHVATYYLIALAAGIIPMFAANVFRYFFDALGLTRISMIIILIAIPFNVALNYIFIFGKLGVPELGGIGAGYATAATYWIILFVSIGMVFRVQALRGFRLFASWARPSLRAWRDILGIGIPIGFSIFFEVSIFAFVTLLMGKMFSTMTVAAHQIALSFSTLIFMVPLSISMGLTILVGYSFGGGRLKAARKYSLLGIGLGVLYMMLCAMVLLLFREQIALLYNGDEELAVLAAEFMVVSIFYQLSDVLQSSMLGILRGYKDVRIPFFIALTAYWIIGIPSGYLLAEYSEFGPYGLWIGIIIGLTAAAIGFFVRLRIVQDKVNRGLLTAGD
ncbi:MATE family efflux transporter [Paenibacillus sp. HB172176]|uniref:MATE family efflux transporter n=1 Tax=Paenibacillus sp. HB172176 TaxID=2493690 RepID=UPI00143CBE5A|nr:MATE family efflux transporter [Paenibacillus sp. HB172176]